ISKSFDSDEESDINKSTESAEGTIVPQGLFSAKSSMAILEGLNFSYQDVDEEKGNKSNELINRSKEREKPEKNNQSLESSTLESYGATPSEEWLRRSRAKNEEENQKPHESPRPWREIKIES